MAYDTGEPGSELDYSSIGICSKEAKSLSPGIKLTLIVFLLDFGMELAGTLLSGVCSLESFFTIEANFQERLKRKTAQHFNIFILSLSSCAGWIFLECNIQNWGSFFGALSGQNALNKLATFRSLNILFYVPFLLPVIFRYQFSTKLVKVKEEGS